MLSEEVALKDMWNMCPPGEHKYCLSLCDGGGAIGKLNPDINTRGAVCSPMLCTINICYQAPVPRHSRGYEVSGVITEVA